MTPTVPGEIRSYSRRADAEQTSDRLSLADRLHEMIEGAPAYLAAQSWRPLIALHIVPPR
ncbi:hypothetical protein [Nocardia sp. CA-119907]|uniref:hypothetical protein n=1 Tax=Nocardia sp. CA-119907 TaxID=3239973 RepID=UPI003D9826BD